MLYVERSKLLFLLNNAETLQELVKLFEDTDIDSGYQEYYDTESVNLQILEASRVVWEHDKHVDKMYLIVNFEVLNTIINLGGVGSFDKYSDTKF